MDLPQVTDTDTYWCTAENSVQVLKSNEMILNFMGKSSSLLAKSCVKYSTAHFGFCLFFWLDIFQFTGFVFSFWAKLNVIKLIYSVLDVPEFLTVGSSLKEVNASLGQTDFSIECVYQGFPSPTINWYKNRESIDNDDRYSIGEVQDEGDNSPYRKTTSSLTIVNGK